ncbi:MAG TPA: hypothetical protein VF510_25430 [Ktedonobacterales bacterium]
MSQFLVSFRLGRGEGPLADVMCEGDALPLLALAGRPAKINPKRQTTDEVLVWM